jgi:DNA polymerase-3 subunit delta'
VAAGSHPDLATVEKPKDRSFLPLALLIGDKEHRGREGLCHHLALKPFMGGRKVAVIDDADYLNPEGANCLLKTLEEPPPRSVLILIGTSPAKQLPTIRSRCQLVRFRPLAAKTVAELLLSRGLVDDAGQARRLAEHAGGSVQRALELADPELWKFRGVLYGRLVSPMLDSLRAAREVALFVEGAGKQPAARRERLRRVVGFAAEFYRGLLRAQSGSAVEADAELDGFVEEARRNAPDDAELSAARLVRCLEAAEQIDRNANQATLIEAWLDDLARGEG